MGQTALRRIRFDAPSRVALYPMAEDLVVIENFNDEAVDLQLGMSDLQRAETLMTLPVDGKIDLEFDGSDLKVSLGARSLVAIRLNG